MIGMGFIVRRFPDLIAGYNTMSKERKKNVDIAGLSALMKKGFIVMGIIIMVSPIILKIIYLDEFASLIMIFVTLIGIMIIILKGQKYDHNAKKKNFFIYIFVGIMILSITGALIHSSMPTKIIMNEEMIQFTGSYGFDLNISDIESVESVDVIPSITMKMNGFNAGYVKKGRFRLESWGVCRLFVTSNKPPYLIISKKYGEKIIVNYKEKTKTEVTYQQIQSLIEK
jgi:hypothetical protein